MASVPTTTSATPLGRIKRSLVQIVLGISAAMPLVIAQGPNIEKALKYGGTTAGAVAIMALIQNIAEHFGWLKPGA